MQLLQNGKQQFFDNSAAPLGNGQVYFYAPGTTDLLPTYADEAGTTENPNPIVLDNAGQAVIWGNTMYRQVVQDSSGTTVWDEVVDASATRSELTATNPSTPPNSGSALISFLQAGSGAISRTTQDKMRDFIAPQDFGVTFDGNTDDSDAWMLAIDAALAEDLYLFIPAGKAVSKIRPGVVCLNGSSPCTPPNNEWKNLKGFISPNRGDGNGGGPVFLCKAPLPNSPYDGTSYMIRGNNSSGVGLGGFAIDCDGQNVNGLDCSWAGGSNGDPSVAPANRNIIRDIWIKNVAAGCTGANFNQVFDGTLDGITVLCKSPDSIAISMQSGGGRITLTNTTASMGTLVIEAQNGTIAHCEIAGGVVLSGQSLNSIGFDGCQIAPNHLTGIIFNSTAVVGSAATHAISLRDCYLATLGYTNPYIFSGNFRGGAHLLNVQAPAQMRYFGIVTGVSGQRFTFVDCAMGSLPNTGPVAELTNTLVNGVRYNKAFNGPLIYTGRQLQGIPNMQPVVSTLIGSGPITFTPDLTDDYAFFDLGIPSGVTDLTLANPLGASAGDPLIIRIRNNSGQSFTPIFGDAYRLGVAVAPIADGNASHFEFRASELNDVVIFEQTSCQNISQ